MRTLFLSCTALVLAAQSEAAPKAPPAPLSKTEKAAKLHPAAPTPDPAVFARAAAARKAAGK